MAWVDPAAADSRTVLASGADALAEYQRALDEWRLLTAAALVGLVEETMTIAAEFAKTRYTLGVPIGTLQGISHPLANIAITVQGGRNLARRAAWFLDNEPDERPGAGAVGVRVHGRRGRQSRDHGGARPGRSRCVGRGRGDRISGAGPGLAAGRRRPRRHRQVTSPRSSPPAKVGSGKDSTMDFSRVELTDDDQAFLDEVRDFLATHVTEDVIRRDRETGDNFDEGVHLALGAAGYLEQEWKTESDGGVHAGCGGASGSWRSAARTCRG